MVIPGLMSLAAAVIGVAAAVYWVYALVEVARIPGWRFYAVDSDKCFWVLVILFLGIVGALLWLFARRSDVLEADERTAPVPPGWYPEPETQALRWWDGFSWTDRYDTWSGDAV